MWTIVGGGIWKYLDDGSDIGTAWQDGGFDDSFWASGPAQLGYKENHEEKRKEMIRLKKCRIFVGRRIKSDLTRRE